MKKIFSLIFVFLVLFSTVALAYDTVEVRTFASTEDVMADAVTTRNSWHQERVVPQGYVPPGLYPGPHNRYISATPMARYHYVLLSDTRAQVDITYRNSFDEFSQPYHYYWR